MRTRAKLTACLVAACFVTALAAAGCSGGGGSSGFAPNVGTPAIIAQATTGRVTFSLGAPTAAAAARHSAYISRGMKSLAVVVSAEPDVPFERVMRTRLALEGVGLSVSFGKTCGAARN